ncbi:hypothetical protein V8C37DRAFT_379064 [Trichoderma ceciliae]
MEANKPEYQHFIPRFLLKNFSHSFVSPIKSKGRKSEKNFHEKNIYPREKVINSLCLSDEFSLDESPVKRTCGLYNMYVDGAKPLEDQRHLETKLSKLEGMASHIYHKIIREYELGRPLIWLKRTEKDVLRKFLFLLKYRGEQFHRRYNFDNMQEYDEDDKELLRDYMKTHGFTKPIDVWFQSLETIIDLEMDVKGDWKKGIRRKIYFPIADWIIDHIGTMYLAICTPENGDEEFVLTENSYNVSEGPTTQYSDESSGKHVRLSPCFHCFAPVSPKLILVLRSNYLPEPNEDANPDVKKMREFQRQLWIDTCFGPGTASILEDLPIQKARNAHLDIIDGRLTPKPGWNQRLSKDDNFCFSLFQIPTRHVRIINGLMIDHAFHGTRIIFNRKDVFLDLMEWFLTEPCEVGKNLIWDHADKQMKYIAGLTRFMLREGRELKPTVTIWPTHTDLDLEQFCLKNIAGARLLEDMMCNEIRKPHGHLDFDTIYEKLGGTTETLNEDMKVSHVMLHVWARNVDLGWGTPEYESIRRKRLNILLDGYQQRQPCVRFWMFLKRIRVALSTQNMSSQLIPDISLLFGDENCRGPEDLLVYAHPIIQACDLNVAMYKAFDDSLTKSRGPGRGMESMGYSTLLGVENRKTPASFPYQNRPCDRNGTQDAVDANKTAESRTKDNARPHDSTIPVSYIFTLLVLIPLVGTLALLWAIKSLFGITLGQLLCYILGIIFILMHIFGR